MKRGDLNVSVLIVEKKSTFVQIQKRRNGRRRRRRRRGSSDDGEFLVPIQR